VEFYTYLWLREDGTPYYVGKGCGKRAFTIDENRQGRMNTPLANAKKIVFHTGRKRGLETRLRIRIKALGRVRSREENLRMSAAFGKLFTFNGETLPQNEWAARLGISSTALGGRLQRGWPLELALSLTKSQGMKLASRR